MQLWEVRAMTDIVERLREKRGVLDNRWPGPTLMDEDAAREIERLRATLGEILKLADGAYASSWLTMPGAWDRINDIRVAGRSALPPAEREIP